MIVAPLMSIRSCDFDSAAIDGCFLHHMNFFNKMFDNEISMRLRLAFLLTLAASMDCLGSPGHQQTERSRQARQIEGRIAEGRQIEQHRERARQVTARLAASRQESIREEQERARRERQRLARAQALQEQRRRRHRCSVLKRRAEVVTEHEAEERDCGRRIDRLEHAAATHRGFYCC